jgi:hypothetical protein
MTNHIHIVTTQIQVEAEETIRLFRLKWETDFTGLEAEIIAEFKAKLDAVRVYWVDWVNVQTITIEQESVTKVEEIRIKITRETTVLIQQIEIENEKTIAALILRLQLNLKAEIERITAYYATLYREEEEKLNIIFLDKVRELEAYYLLQIDGINAHYLQVIVDLEAEWNLKVSVEIDRITKVSHDIIVKFQLDMDIDIQVKRDQIREQTILLIGGLEEEARLKIELVRQTVTVHIE